MRASRHIPYFAPIVPRVGLLVYSPPGIRQIEYPIWEIGRMAEARSWHEQVARVIMAMATPDYPATLVSVLRTLVPFDYSVMFAYRGDAAPIDLFDDFPPTKRRVFVTLYQEGPYLLDPFFLACRGKVDAGLYRLRAFAPDRFYQS